MTDNLPQVETSPRQPSYFSHLVLWVLTWSLSAALAFTAYLGFSHNHHVDQRSQLDHPPSLLVQDLDTLDVAVAALAVESLSDRHSSINVEIWGGDKAIWTKHLSNAATRQGWFPHSLDDQGLRIILPAHDLPLLQAAAEDPYGWLSTHRNDDANPKPPALGQEPAYVQVHTSIHGQERAALLLLGAIFAALAAAILFFIQPLKTLARLL